MRAGSGDEQERRNVCRVGVCVGSPPLPAGGKAKAGGGRGRPGAGAAVVRIVSGWVGARRVESGQDRTGGQASQPRWIAMRGFAPWCLRRSVTATADPAAAPAAPLTCRAAQRVQSVVEALRVSPHPIPSG